MDKKTHGVFDILALTSAILAATPNIPIFLILLFEQINTGWGFPTCYEMLVLLFWLVQIFTIPLILFGMIYIVISLIKRNKCKIFFANIAITLAAILCLVLSVVFEFN